MKQGRDGSFVKEKAAAEHAELGSDTKNTSSLPGLK
jgi:hypothetical protein